jgi:heme exporter protein A
VIASYSLGIKFESKWVFRGVTFSLCKADCLLVLGPNGAGKSTLLKLLAGFLQPSEGKIQRPSLGALGYAALDMNLYPTLTALEHLHFAAKLRKITAHNERLLTQVGLSSQANLPVSGYSTGMRMRLKLALAIQIEPSVLLLDEPSAALDKQGYQILEEIIKQQTQRGVVILATNNSQDRGYATHELVLS